MAGTHPPPPAVRCTAHSKTTGVQCKRFAIPGGNVCKKHGGGAPAVKAKAAIRHELYLWGLTDQTVDPGETLLRLLTQSSMRVAKYAEELEALVNEEPSLREALIGETWVKTENGSYKAGEYIRGLARLEAEERDRCASFAAKAIAAGLNERIVRMAERQGEMLSAMVIKALAEANLSEDQATAVKASIGRQVRELSPSPST